MARLRQIDPTLRVSNLNDLTPLCRSEDMAKYSEGMRKRDYPSDRYRQTCRRVRSLVPSDCVPKRHGPRSKSSKVVFLRLLCLVGTAVQTRHANRLPASISCQGSCGPRRYLLRQPPAASSSTVRGGLQPMTLASPWKRRRSRRQPARPYAPLVGVRGLLERGLIEGPPHELETDRHPARGEAAWDRERWKTGE
jgi:hypothetical protein